MYDPLAEERVLDRPPVQPPRTLRYGGHPDQVYDLWAATDPAAPLVILIHGGFWKQAYDRKHLSPLAAHLAGQGFTAALVEYRRAGGDGGYPATLDDIACAVDTVPSAAPPLLLGHSAGGHLALWAAARHLLPPDAPWRGGRRAGGVVALAPVADLAAAVRDGLGAGAAGAFLGGPDHVAARLPYTDPVALGPTGVPTVLLHGEEDPDVPLSQSRAYAATDPAVRLVALPATGHYAPLDPGTAACAAVVDALTGLAAGQGEDRAAAP